MTTPYECPGFFTKNGNGVAPSSAPTITITDKDNNILVGPGQAVTALTNLVGAYRYQYDGAAGLTLYYKMITTDLTVDQYEVAGIPNINPVIRAIQLSSDLTSTIPDTIPADGSLPNTQQAIYMILQMLAEKSVSGTTVTVKKVDGSTTLFTLTINDSTNPTSITRAT